MITWPKQEEALLLMNRAMRAPENQKINFEKSREQGGTWLVLVDFDWWGRFCDKPESFLIASRNQEMVDDSENTDTLFSKLDFLQSYLPEWLQDLVVKGSRIENQVKYVNGTVINGQSTTVDLGRGGRRTAGMLDESAKMKNQAKIDRSVNDAWHLRIKVATPAGPSTEFSRDKGRPGVEFLTLHWSDNPQHSKGLYLPKSDGSIEFLDHDYWTPERRISYDFQKFISSWPTSNPRFPQRSPYYDRECESRSRADVAENLDINDFGQKTLFFLQTPAMTEDYQRVKSLCREPLESGSLEYDHETGHPSGFLPATANKRLIFNLWIKTGGSRPAEDQSYGMGVDVSQGTGYSNSTISVGNLRTREKICEVVTAHMEPEKFVVLCCAVGRWFGGERGEAQMIWGKQGPGRNFSKKVYELGYRNVYSRKGDGWNEKWTLEPGISEDPDGKLSMMTGYRAALFGGQFWNPSELAIEECLCYTYNDKGYVEHTEENSAEDPSGARYNHGDRCVADAMLNVLFGPPAIDEEKQEEFQAQSEPVPYSYAWRREKWTQQQSSTVY